MNATNHSVETLETPHSGDQLQERNLKILNAGMQKNGSVIGYDGSKNGYATTVATKCLNNGLADIKRWAADIGISERVVRLWASGQKTIPEMRIKQIIVLAKKYFFGLRQLENAVDQILTKSFSENNYASFES